MNIQAVMSEALTYCEQLSPDARGTMHGIVLMPRAAVITLLDQALKSGDPEAIRFHRVAFVLHAAFSAIQSLDRPT